MTWTRLPSPDGAADPSRVRRLQLGTIALFATFPLSALADQWRVESSVRVRESITTNLGLDRPGDDSTTSLVTEVSPRVRLTGRGTRYDVRVNYQLQSYLYSAGNQDSELWNVLDASGNLEVVKDFLFLDAGARAVPTLLDGRGAFSIDNALPTPNRYSAYTYRLSPYIRGQLGRNTAYLLRWNNTFTENSLDALRDSYESRVLGQLNGSLRVWDWSLDYDRTGVEYDDQPALTTEVARGILSYPLTSRLRVSGRLGYERNDYALTESSGPVYGAGVDWRPNPRVGLDAFAEHRFFGLSYGVNASYRKRRAALRLSASRNTTSYTEQFTLQPGLAFEVVDAALSSRIPDPVEREVAVRQFLEQTALPAILVDPLTFYTNQILLQERLQAALHLTGRRNAVVFSVYWLDQEPISAAGTPSPIEVLSNRRRQSVGFTANWTYRLSAKTNLNLLAQQVYTDYPDGFASGSSDYRILRAHMSTRVGARTSVFGGARYQEQESDSAQFAQYREAAVFAGFDYTFR